jgi:hypothetical protein
VFCCCRDKRKKKLLDVGVFEKKDIATIAPASGHEKMSQKNTRCMSPMKSLSAAEVFKIKN